MGALQKIAIGTPPGGVDGDTVRAAFIKVNANTDAVATQSAFASGADLTAPGALTSANVGQRLNINLSAPGTFNLPSAVTCQKDQVIYLRNIGTAVATLAKALGTTDTLGVTVIAPGSSFTLDTDGATGWKVLAGQATGDTTVHGTLSTDGAASVGGLLSANAGATVHGGATADTLHVTGTSQFDGDVAANKVTAATLNSTGLATANGGQAVTNGLTADTAHVTGATNLDGAVTMAGAVAVTGTLTARANPNLLYNGSGEFGDIGWSGTAFGGLVDPVTALGSQFVNAAPLAAPTADSGTIINVGPGIALNLAGSVLASGVTSGVLAATLTAYKADGTSLGAVCSLTGTNGTGWAHKSATGTTPALTAYVQLTKGISGTVAATAKGAGFKRLKVELGTVGTMYSQEASIAAAANASSQSTQSSSLLYLVGTTDVVGTFASGDTALRTPGFIAPFVSVNRSGLTLRLGTHFTLRADGIHIDFMDPLNGNEEIEVRLTGTYNPSTVYLPSFPWVQPLAGTSYIAYPHTPGFAYLTLRGVWLSPGEDYTEDATGFTLVGFTADGSEKFGILTLNPINVANALAATNPVIASGGLTFPDGRVQGAAASNPNLLVNGNFDVWQNGASFSNATSNSTAYIADCWQVFRAAYAGGYTAQLVAGVTTLPGSTNVLQINRTAGDTSTAVIDVSYSFESVQVKRLRGRKYTLSFCVAGIGALIGQSFSVRAIFGTGTDSTVPTGFTGVTSSAWDSKTLNANFTQRSFTFDIPNNASQMGIIFEYVPTGTAVAGDGFFLAQVKLETGGAATPFVPPNPFDEETICKRYYQQVVADYQGYQLMAQNVIASLALPVAMRANPACSMKTAGSLGNTSTPTLFAYSNTRISFQGNATATGMLYFVGYVWQLDARL